MDFFTVLNKRGSVRQFTDKPVPREMLEIIVNAARKAPTANNIQPWEFIVITQPEMLLAIAAHTDHGRFIQDAPACIAVFCADTKYYLEDGCAAVENILLAATALHLGACWVAGDKKPYTEQIGALLQAPEKFRLVALIPLGYPVNAIEPREKRPLNAVIHWEKF
ncbi:MAG TPA: nitroreductase family protein [bacterium]|nr:nitroreductase family protein [bacterium]HPN43283.1 nitroreductase family protein [bacterium]